MPVNEASIKEMVDLRVGGTGDAAAENGTILARIAYALASIRKGAGSALAAARSLVDAIGHDGTNHLNTGLDADTQYLSRTALAAPTSKSVASYVADQVAPTYAVVPTLATAIRPTSAAANWTYGGYTEMHAGLGSDAWVTGVTVFTEDEATTPEFQLAIATGAVAAEVDKVVVRFNQPEANVAASFTFSLTKAVKVASGTRISCRVAASNGAGGAKSVDCTIQYVTGL